LAVTGPNASDLILKLVDEPSASGSVVLDNHGARSTGATRLDASLAVNSRLTIGDQATVRYVRTEGSDFARLAYSIPVGYDGWRVEANASVLAYKLVADEFKALDAHGTVNSFGGYAGYPILRSPKANLYLLLNFDRKSFRNTANGVRTSDYGVDDASAGLSGNLFDTLGGGGYSSASAVVSAGRFDAKGGAARPDASDTSFVAMRYALSRQQSVTPSFSVYGALIGQFASRNLDSSERFYLGGPSGVRAYPINEAGGAQGRVLTLEGRYRLTESTTISGFYDQGWITRYKFDSMTAGGLLSGTSPNRYSLKGYGLSVGWAPLAALQLQAIWARRAGANPDPTAAGNDQDGTLRKDRFWLAGTFMF
jgi:hemolysin activation/secretion protein